MTARWISPDGLGSLEVLEVFGNDLTVVNAARVSFAKESTEFGPKDEGLINYLAKHHHDSPFFSSSNTSTSEDATVRST